MPTATSRARLTVGHQGVLDHVYVRRLDDTGAVTRLAQHRPPSILDLSRGRQDVGREGQTAVVIDGLACDVPVATVGVDAARVG